MRYTKFIIKKYKAVSDVELPLDRYNLIPIIGINESGKTSILHAILSFDNYNDDYLNGQHLEAKNRYQYDATGHIVIAKIILDDHKDLDLIREELNLKRSNKLYTEIENLHKQGNEIILIRNLDNKEYDIENNFYINGEQKTKLISCLLTNTPFILLFDDFTDRVPEKITFSKNYTDQAYNKDQDSLRKEWNIFLEEIFTRATNRKYTLKNFLLTQKEDDRKGILSDISDRLNLDVITDWEKLKVLKSELKNEIKKLKLYLDYKSDSSGNHIFSFGVEDKNFEGKARHFQVSERSKGFQWFFNFAIKLKYNPKYSKDYQGAIYLLDEPGSYLHSSAQEELLKSLKSISDTNKVIYCTHSQYLLNPNIINVNNIKISNRDHNNGLISLINFSEYPCNYNQGALSPLMDALHLNITKHINFKDENIIITEGITDFYFFKMINEFTTFLNDYNFIFVPGAGASNLKELISFAIAWSKKYAVLFDSDPEGQKQFTKYKKFFGDEEANKWYLYTLKNKSTDIELEDLLLSKDQLQLKKITKSCDVKHGLIVLYFMNTDIKKLYFKNLQEGSKSRISKVTEDIISKFCC